jgi:hypothetical protein
VLDCFKLDDAIIPHLRVLTQKVRNTQWESALRMPQWGLSYEQASSLSRAMHADLKHRTPKTVQVCIFPILIFSLTTWLIWNKVSMSSGLVFCIFFMLVAFFAVGIIYIL